MRFLAFLLPTLLAAAPGRAHGQEFRCEAPIANAWLTTAPEGFRDRPPIDWQIQPVRKGMDAAVALLATRPVRPLTRSQAARPTGAGAPVGASALRPWLVRAVYPVPSPSLRAVWLGAHRLVVTADGMGCAPFIKHPLVLWLDRAPVRLFVVAGADL